MDCVIYCRGTHDDSDLSIFSQIDACRRYAEENDFDIQHLYIDEENPDESLTSRKGLFSLLLHIEDLSPKESDEYAVLVYDIGILSDNDDCDAIEALISRYTELIDVSLEEEVQAKLNATMGMKREISVKK